MLFEVGQREWAFERPQVGRDAACEIAPVEVVQTRVGETLERCGGNHSRAAEMLGIGRTTLWRKLKEYGLDR